MPEKIICQWARSTPLMIEYHDKEWGTPLHDDQKHFEFIILDGAQAGLSWSTVLNKRENYRRAFDNFDVEKVARYSAKKLESLMKDEGIIRNRLKVQSTVTNAKAFLKVQEEFGEFDRYIWQFVGGKPIQNKWVWGQIPAKTKESDAMSKDLLARGFKFVGSTICYSYMQAAGMVNDHTTECWRWKQLAKEK